MTERKVATPLPAHSPKLRDHRYEVDVLGEKNERGGRLPVASGRFVTAEAAKAWADAEHPEGVAVLTFYSARRGWQSQAIATRRDGAWQGR